MRRVEGKHEGRGVTRRGERRTDEERREEMRRGEENEER